MEEKNERRNHPIKKGAGIVVFVSFVNFLRLGFIQFAIHRVIRNHKGFVAHYTFLLESNRKKKTKEVKQSCFTRTLFKPIPKKTLNREQFLLISKVGYIPGRIRAWLCGWW